MKSWILSLAALAVFQAHGFEVSSTDMREEETLTQAQVFNGFGCQGQNISPQIA